MTKVISLLGATGSIGTQVLDVARRFQERFRIEGLAGGHNLERLAAQVREFRPRLVSICEPQAIAEFRRLCPEFQGEVLCGTEGLNALAGDAGIDTVIVGLVGLIGLEPSLTALRHGKKLLTANKETFVAGGHLVQPYLDQVIPIDSEHVAIHQSLQTRGVSQGNAVRKIILTASGGPFRNHTREEMARVTLQEALNHPNWVMGRKITVDSATMMNKGLEIIEAHWLFGLPYERIQVVVHPESIIHGGVEFEDGAIVVQMGAPDMHGPIQYAMTWPERLLNPEPGVRLDLLGLARLHLEAPDPDRFPCLRLAMEAGKLGSSATAVLNSADEEAVKLFLEERIRFVDIAALLENALEAHVREGLNPSLGLDEIHHLDQWARDHVSRQAQQAALA